jgi:acyl-CoA synthetase (AMP-forming)/AMP-acid ligase II
MTAQSSSEVQARFRAELTTWLTPEIQDRFEAAGLWTDETWVERAQAWTDADPTAACVVDEQGRLSRGEVAFQGRRVAAYLQAQGVTSGDVITLVLPNWREFVVIHAAIGYLGAVVNPLLPKVGWPEMRHVIATAQSRFVFAADAGAAPTPYARASMAAADCASVIEVLSVRGDNDQLAEVLRRPWEQQEHPLPAQSAAARDWDTITFTSGTEAMPKGVVHTHQTTMYGLRSYVQDILRLTDADCVFAPSPICHASGIEWGLRTALITGCPIVLQDRWDPARALQLVDEHQCTYTLAATPFIVDLIAARQAGLGDGRSLRYVASGGAPIPRILVSQVRESFQATLMAVFGASETYITTATRPGQTDSMLASDGEPLPGILVDILDPNGRAVARGTEGEIVTHGPQVFLGYLGDPALTERTFLDKWYRFGDLGRIDENGMLHVTGRLKDIVIRGGENISVRETEDLLIRHPDVDSVAVVGYPDDRLGERCCAVIVAAAGAIVTLEAINAYLLEQGLAKFKLPERLHLTSSIPLTATGKIRKAELRELVRGGLNP